jgi:hypothetical protein
LEVIVTRNPYAPPKAEVADRVGDPASPALWNPGAAANNSINALSRLAGIVLFMPWSSR